MPTTLPITLPMTATCRGEATLWSSRAGAEGPKRLPFSFDVNFTNTSGAWQVVHFMQILIPGISFGGITFSLTVDLMPTATGTWDPVTGAMSVTASFLFQFDLPILPASTLQISLSTEADLPPPPHAVQGRRLNTADGSVVLAGIGQFVGSLLDGDQCAIELQGLFTPNIAA